MERERRGRVRVREGGDRRRDKNEERARDRKKERYGEREGRWKREGATNKIYNIIRTGCKHAGVLFSPIAFARMLYSLRGCGSATTMFLATSIMSSATEPL